MNTKLKTITWLIIFSIAMGYMESAIVIYLRKIYYPNGFHFPLVALDPDIGLVELFREAATIIMLLGIGILTGKTASQKFAHFIFCFAIWDICYYIFLWIFLGWPQSLFTWDILFLIPVPWVGPVITPCIVSSTMILLALTIMYFHRLGVDTRLKIKEWGLLITGSFTIILSFIWDYLSYTYYANSTAISNSLSGQHNMLSDIKDYIPVDFNWGLFLVGEAILLSGILFFIRRLRKGKNNSQ
jgi:hypothetical protein